MNKKNEIWYVKKSTDPDTTGVLVSKINNPDDDSFITIFSGTKEECDRFCETRNTPAGEKSWMKQYLDSSYGNDKVNIKFGARDINNASCEILKALELTSRLNDDCTNRDTKLFSINEIEYIMHQLGITAYAESPVVKPTRIDNTQAKARNWYVTKSSVGTYSIDPCLFNYNDYKADFQGSKDECEKYVYEHTHHRMTNYELAKWLSEGPVKNEVREAMRDAGDACYASGYWLYKSSESDEAVADSTKIRVNNGEWKKPLAEGQL